MNNLLFFLQTEAAATGSKGSGWTFWVLIIVLFLIMYLFMMRPQRKQQKELQKFREGLKKGDKVITVGGIYGTVVEVKDQTVIIEVDNNVKIKVSKNSLVRDSSEAQQQQPQQ